MSKRKKQAKPAINFDVLKQINQHAAGIDIGAEEIYVCVPSGRSEERVRSFASFTVDLPALADWLEQCGVQTVAMASTSISWIALFDILEGRGLEVYLVNARHLKNVTGRKSDVSDCEWLYQLHTYGLLRGSFHPAEQIRALRSLARQREMLVSYRAWHSQHRQKALELMNVKLTYVLSDMTGVTGMTLIRSILAGEHNRQVLAQHREAKGKHSQEEIAKALTGNYRREHLFALQQALDLYDFYGRQIEAVAGEMETMYAAITPAAQQDDEPPTPPTPSRQKRGKNQAHFDLTTSLYRLAGVDLTQVDGLDALTVQAVLTEVGVDVTKWPTVKHFTSWLGLSPNNQITGGKVKRRRPNKTDNRAAAALRLAAHSLARSQSALGAFYRRIRARHGAPQALVATAHKLARIIYFMLKNRSNYVDVGAEQYDERQRAQAIKRLQRQAAKLGLRLEGVPAQPVAT